MTIRFPLALVLALGLPAMALADPAMTADSAKGKVLTDAAGMSLYTFDMDKVGKSACTGACATNWPPLAAASSDMASGDWTLITRDGGVRQWAYKGKPLYTFKMDMAKGDQAGDGVKGIWHLARP
ncbi:MAG: hypothetical protein GC186_10985 [Rhodobacteraceae bacterium]|nr:hypothetical protein [Paracoccaceae bacterium]